MKLSPITNYHKRNLEILVLFIDYVTKQNGAPKTIKLFYIHLALCTDPGLNFGKILMTYL